MRRRNACRARLVCVLGRGGVLVFALGCALCMALALDSPRRPSAAGARRASHRWPRPASQGPTSGAPLKLRTVMSIVSRLPSNLPQPRRADSNGQATSTRPNGRARSAGGWRFRWRLRMVMTRGPRGAAGPPPPPPTRTRIVERNGANPTNSTDKLQTRAAHPALRNSVVQRRAAFNA